jgi:hypothetical protein
MPPVSGGQMDLFWRIPFAIRFIRLQKRPNVIRLTLLHFIQILQSAFYWRSELGGEGTWRIMASQFLALLQKITGSSKMNMRVCTNCWTASTALAAILITSSTAEAAAAKSWPHAGGG